MAVRPVHSIGFEADLDAALTSMRARRQAAASEIASDQAAAYLSERVARVKELAPWAKPQVLVQVATSDMDLESDETRNLLRAVGKMSNKHHWYSPIGSVVKAAASGVGSLEGAVRRNVVNPVADFVTPEVVENVAGAVADANVRNLRAGARGVALGAQSLYEEGQGVVRNVASWDPGGVPVGGALVGGATAAALAVSAPVSVTGAALAGVVAAGAAAGAAGGLKVKGNARWEPQSSGAIALGRALHGERVDLGSGWLPNVNAGEDAENPNATFTIGEEQRQRARRVNIGGSAVTPGRLVTASVLEPGTEPYNVLSGLVDGSLAMSRFDPAAALGRGIGNVNRNRKLFVEAGGLLANRPAISAAKAQSWWDGATDLRRTLVETGDFYSIWKATKGQLGARVTDALAKATDEAQVDAIVRPLLGEELRGPFSYSTRRPFSNVRLLDDMPGHTIDLLDPDQSVREAELWMKNMRAPEEFIARHTAALADAQTRVGRRGAYRSMLDSAEDLLVDRFGVERGRAKALTRAEEMADEETRKFLADSISEGIPVENIYVAGAPVPAAKPYTYNEFINRAMPLPDARDLRRATSRFRAILDNDAVDVGESALDFVQGNVWKKSALVRFAYAARVIGEEQIRMAASGLDSLVNHPLSLIAWRLGHKGTSDIHGEQFLYRDAGEFVDGMDDFNKALNREFSFNGWANERNIPFWKNYRKDQDGFARALSGEIVQLAHDPHVREVARNLDDLDGVKALGWGNGATKVADASTSLQRYRLVMAEEAGGLLDRGTWDRYVDSLGEIVRHKTGGDADLIDAIRNGRLGDAPLLSGMNPSKEVVQHVADRLDLFPDEMLAHGQMSIAERGAGARLDAAVRWMFSNLMAERTNNLSRSPAFRQFYAQRMTELAPFMDDAAHAQALSWARSNKLDDIASTIGKITERGTVTADHADIVAKGFALDETKGLLYDLSKRSQFFDAARLIFPFGEAWKELVTTWARIGLKERPQVLRRAQQVVTGARAGDPDGDGKGFFYTNEYGEEVFTYPGSEWVNEKLTGVPVPLTGRVAGLSLMTDVLPGVGPAVQFSAGAFLPDKPKFDRIRGLLFPFGEPDTSHGVVESLMPAWVKKLQQATGAGRDERQWNSTVMDVARWLSSTGDYDTSSVDGMNHLMDDAKKKAQVLFAVRGAAQFFAPTAPTPEWVVRDKNGDVQVAQMLVEDFQRMRDKDPNNAVTDFLDRYGDNVFLLMQGKTAEVTPGAPITREGADWERAHGEIVKRYPNVFGFFAPSTGDLDPSAFDRTVDQGRRVPLTVDQYLRLANDRVANAIYHQARASLGSKPNSAQQSLLRDFKTKLIEMYPGFTDRSGVPERASRDTLIRDLTAAVDDERLADNPLTGPLRVYLAARETASQVAQQRGLSPTGFRSSKRTADIRGLLRGLGEQLAARSPEFSQAWERVFDGELSDEETADGQ